MSRRSRIRRRGWQLWDGDSADLLRQLPENHCDSMVTDPPAGISFMGQEWDKDKGGRDEWIAWLASIMVECHRVLKPGAHILVWAIPRTSHWTATAIENAGFEIRDVVSHLFGTGFPKSLNFEDGQGTALKPAAEHWILARKPCAWSIAKNLKKYGTGALNIDGCRIPGEPWTWGTQTDIRGGGYNSRRPSDGDVYAQNVESHPGGRWPAHLALSHSDECIIAWRTETRSVPKHAFSFKTGQESPGYEVVFDGEDIVCVDSCPVKVLEQQGADPSFFYVAKPDRGERDLGCGNLPWKTGGELTGRQEGSAGLANPRAGAGRTSGGRNLHPTCKSMRLMRWLCRLITPQGGLVLDPFAGSGSTGAAALAEGLLFLGMELSPEYAEIARARLSYVAAHPDEVPEP